MPISTPPITETTIRIDDLGFATERGTRAVDHLMIRYETNKHPSNLRFTAFDGSRWEGRRFAPSGIRVLVLFGVNLIYTSTYPNIKAAEQCGVLCGLIDATYSVAPVRNQRRERTVA